MERLPGLVSLLRVVVSLLHVFVVWIVGVDGMIQCECTTYECQSMGESTCMGVTGCYTEIFHNVLTKGCDPTALYCENRQPTNLKLEWPTLYCCSDVDLCNKDNVPESELPVKGKPVHPEPTPEHTEDSNCSDANTPPDSQPKQPPESTPNLSANTDTDSNPNPDSNPNSHQTSHSDSHPGTNYQTDLSRGPKSINPIYIAVPVAGVCVLLALIIFAMYLLRRRTDYHHQHDNFLHYHPQLAPVMAQQKAATVPPGRHMCHCTCKRQVVPVCSSRCAETEVYSCSNANRCTDSERSSSGSETRLFLQT